LNYSQIKFSPEVGVDDVARLLVQVGDPLGELARIGDGGREEDVVHVVLNKWLKKSDLKYSQIKFVTGSRMMVSSHTTPRSLSRM
jgi:hypothetical protein